MYKLLKGLTAPLKPGERSFDELKQLMLHHQNPCPNMIAKRFKFNSCVRNGKKKCFNVRCRIEEVGRILQIRRIVKRYAEGQINLVLIMKEPNNAC